MNKVWQPKKVIKCDMCSINHSNIYKIIDLSIWWLHDTAYIKYNFCSICYTILNKLWPNDTKFIDNNKFNDYEEEILQYSSGYLYNRIKNTTSKYNLFLQNRSNYVKNITYPSIIYQLHYDKSFIFHYIPKDIIQHILHIFLNLNN